MFSYMAKIVGETNSEFLPFFLFDVDLCCGGAGTGELEEHFSRQKNFKDSASVPVEIA